MILRAGQRRKNKELHYVDWELVLNDRDVTPDRFGRVMWKTKDVSDIDNDAPSLPPEKQLPVLGNLVLAFFHGQEIIWIDALEIR